MKESIATNRISVLFFYDGDEDYARPARLLWQDREFELAPVKFWHSTHHDGHLRHHYTLSDVDYEYTFQLVLETEAMTWQLARAVQSGSEAAETPVMQLRTNIIGAAA